MADDAPQDTAPQDSTGDSTPQAGQEPAEKTVPLADLVKERKERQRLAKELEQFRTASLSDAEKAVAEAEKRGEEKATGRLLPRLVDEAFRSATAGRALKSEALLSFDRSQFLTDDGDVNRDALSKWVSEHSTEPGPPRFGSADQGVRKTSPPAGGDERTFVRELFGSG